jgi:transposase-like protein
VSEPRLYPGTGPDERTHFTPYGAFEVPADLRELFGRFDVEATAKRVRNFRYAEEWIMLTLGGWLATLPEVPVKTGLGKIIWESAQSADALGKRLPELRCGRASVAASEAPNAGFAALIQAIAEPERPDLSIEKLAGLFDVLKPHLLAVYERTARETDPITDAPTVEILEDLIRRTRRHVAWADEVLERLCDTDGKRERRRRRANEVRARLEACGGVTGALADESTRAN